MIIILKHTLNSARKNALQVFIVLLTVVIISVAVLLAYSSQDIFAVVEESWLTRATMQSDIVFETDGGKDVTTQLEQFSNCIECANLCTRRDSIFIVSDNAAVRAHFSYADLDQLIEATNTVVLDSAVNTTAFHNITISQDVAEKCQLKAGDTARLNYNGVYTNYFVRYVVEAANMYSTVSDYVVTLPSDSIGSARYHFFNYLYLKDNAKTAEGEDAKTAIMRYLATLEGVRSVTDGQFPELQETRIQQDNGMFTVAMAAVVLLMCFILLSSYSIIVNSRADELIKFKATGATPTQCTGIMLFEAAIYGIVGAAAGVFAGRSIYDLLLRIIQDSLRNRLSPTGLDCTLTFFTVLTITLLACLPPIVRMSKRSIRMLMSNSQEIVKKDNKLLMVLSTLLFAAMVTSVFFVDKANLAFVVCLLLVSLGVWLFFVTPAIIRFFAFVASKILRKREGFVATRTVTRNKKCVTVVIITSLIIACVWLITGFIGMAESIANTYGDRIEQNYLVYVPHRLDGMREKIDKVMGECDKVGGVSQKNVYRYVSVLLNEEGYNVYEQIALHVFDDPYQINYVTDDLDKQALDDFVSVDNAIILGNEIAVLNNIKVGDEIRLKYNYIEGNTILTSNVMKVVGIDYTAVGWGYVCFAKEGACNFYLDNGKEVTGGYRCTFTGDENKFREYQQAVSAIAPDCIVMFTSDFDSQSPLVKDLLKTIDVIKVSLFAIALIGLTNTVVAACAGRKKEMGIYRDVGLTVGGAARLTLAEGVIMTVTSLCLGIVLSIVFNRLCFAIAPLVGIYTRYVFLPPQILVVSAVIGALALLMWFVCSWLQYKRR